MWPPMAAVMPMGSGWVVAVAYGVMARPWCAMWVIVVLLIGQFC